MDCSLPGSSIHKISQAIMLDWVAISFSRDSSQLRNWTPVSCTAGGLLHCRQILHQLSFEGTHRNDHSMLICGNRKSFILSGPSLQLDLPLQPAHDAGPLEENSQKEPKVKGKWQEDDAFIFFFSNQALDLQLLFCLFSFFHEADLSFPTAFPDPRVFGSWIQKALPIACHLGQHPSYSWPSLLKPSICTLVALEGRQMALWEPGSQMEGSGSWSWMGETFIPVSVISSAGQESLPTAKC